MPQNLNLGAWKGHSTQYIKLMESMKLSPGCNIGQSKTKLLEARFWNIVQEGNIRQCMALAEEGPSPNSTRKVAQHKPKSRGVANM